jgi:hypothetical protein
MEEPVNTRREPRTVKDGKSNMRATRSRHDNVIELRQPTRAERREAFLTRQIVVILKDMLRSWRTTCRS